MANEIAVDSAGKIDVVQAEEQLTCIALEAIVAGAPCRLDPTTGKARNGNGSDMTEGRYFGIALRTAAAGEPVTLLREGIVDGFDLSGLNYGVTIYLSDTDARISGTAGTKAVTVGFVVPGNAKVLGDSPDKLLLLDPSLSLEIA